MGCQPAHAPRVAPPLPARSARTRAKRAALGTALLASLLIFPSAARAQVDPDDALAPAAPQVADSTTGPGLSDRAALDDAARVYVPDLTRLLPNARSRETLSSSLQILVMLTLLTVAPSIVLMMTSFTRMLVVLVLLRQALGTQQLPPSQVLTGLALFMTFLAMAPTYDRMKTRAIDPYLDGRIGQIDAIAAGSDELRSFMFEQIEAAGNEQDVYMMHEYASQRSIPDDQQLERKDVSLAALIPAFLLSELKTAFVIGFRIYLPFLVIDMVIATVLVSMGMMMLPPVLISLPFKLLLFVLVDGWHLIAGALMASFG